jgi:RNA polymerase sigma-70 factor (ECF subfamily)
MRLLPRIAAQDGQAFEAFYTQYAYRLQHYLIRLLGDPTLAEDVRQDVMLVVWQQAGRFPATVPPWAWLCGIARHKARAARRKAARLLPPGGPADRQAAAPDVLLLRQEAGRVFEQALDRLPFYEQTALRLLVQQGCSYQDIAQVMDTPLSTVRTRLWRACHRLRASGVAVDAPPRRRSARVAAGRAGRRARSHGSRGGAASSPPAAPGAG